MKLRPALAFAVGLWVGGLAMAVVVLAVVRPWGAARRDTGTPAAGTTESSAAEVRTLRQENARLNAEIQRLRQTVTEARRQAQLPSELPPGRRVPVRRLPVAAPAPATPAIDWPALLRGDTAEAFAALAQVIKAGQVDTPHRIAVAQRAGAVLELHADLAEGLRQLLQDGAGDRPLIMGALEGLTNPVLPPAVESPDYELRLRLVDECEAAAGDDASLQAAAARARDELQTRSHPPAETR